MSVSICTVSQAVTEYVTYVKVYDFENVGRWIKPRVLSWQSLPVLEISIHSTDVQNRWQIMKI